MSRLKQVGLLLANLVFYAFLAAYWYLATNLPPWHALVGALLSYGLFLALRDRLRIPGPSPLIVALAGVLFFFMFSPLPSLRGLSQMVWLVLSAVLFRLCFSQLAAFPSKAGALAASYILFLTLPMGMPRLTSTEPSTQPGEPMDVAVIGAGFGGLAVGKELLDSGVTNFRIYEAAPEVGGTWWHNRYPGLHVDVRSALYSFSTYPNPDWSRRWAPRAELLDYAVSVSKAFGVRPFVAFESWVQGLQFNEQTGLWDIRVGGETVQAHNVVMATGGLHIPNSPQFAGSEDFSGRIFHSARWPDDADLAGKRVAIIGSGASAVQIIPEIAKEAARVDMYQRTPNWVSPSNNTEVPGWQQAAYRYVPMAYKFERLRTHVGSELGFRATFPLDSEYRGGLEDWLTNYIEETVDDAELAAVLTPDYEFGCKRPLVTQFFYPSLNRDNVNVITEGIERFTPAGIAGVDGTAWDYDVIILATGYRVAQLPFPIEGLEGQSLEALWEEKPAAYESMMVNGFPNLYLMSGPNSGLFGSIIIHIESAANYIAQVIDEVGTDQLIQPTLEAQTAYNDDLQAKLQTTVWAGSCKSWYKLDDGTIVANNPYPISEIVYNRAQPNWAHFTITER
ncbi:MAG: NAD(P)/FAD-dependent oxidoreductase [Halieaceae bacterium]|nr:NAD(P)/FAD-dependent oxidoreductase [Halieaceae bacterium]